MTAHEAINEACREAMARFIYRLREGRDWQTPEQTERCGSGCCRDFAWWAIHRCLPLFPSCSWRIVIGQARGGCHAWVELIDEAGARWWADPTPGYLAPVDRPETFARTPEWAYPCDEYGPRECLAY